MSKYAKLSLDNIKEILQNNDDDFSQRKKGDLDFDHIKQLFNDALLWTTREDTNIPEYTYSNLWYPSDSEDFFNKNFNDPETYKMLKKLNWIDEHDNPVKITYNLNEQGFRCKNFDSIKKEFIMFLGCSQTFGVAIQNEFTFAQLVADKFNCENVNLGCPGKGFDFISLYVSLFLEQDNLDLDLIKAIVVYLPPPGRISYFHSVNNQIQIESLHNDRLLASDHYNENGITFENPMHKINVEENEMLTESWWESLYHVRSNKFENYIIQKENNFIRDIFAYGTIDAFAKKHGVPLVVMNRNSYLSNIYDFGRDLMHMGSSNHRSIAKHIVMKLEQIFDK